MSSNVRPPIIELVAVRTKEFLRETEAIFWVFGFPLLLALALGFAFRAKAPDKIPIGVVEGPHAQERVAALAKSPVLLPRVYSADEGRNALRLGRISLLVEEGSNVAPPPSAAHEATTAAGVGGATLSRITYRFDPTRPDSRTARIEADDALQAASGRRNVFKAREERVTQQGSRSIDFLMPGLVGMNLMSTGMWGMGFAIVNARMRKLLKRLVATPMRKSHYILSFFLGRMIWLVIE